MIFVKSDNESSTHAGSLCSFAGIWYSHKRFGLTVTLCVAYAYFFYHAYSHCVHPTNDIILFTLLFQFN